MAVTKENSLKSFKKLEKHKKQKITAFQVSYFENNKYPFDCNFRDLIYTTPPIPYLSICYRGYINQYECKHEKH